MTKIIFRLWVRELMPLVDLVRRKLHGEDCDCKKDEYHLQHLGSWRYYAL